MASQLRWRSLPLSGKYAMLHGRWSKYTSDNYGREIKIQQIGYREGQKGQLDVRY